MCQGGAGTDRGEELNAYGKLNAAGSTLTSAGADATGDATAYYKNLLSGNPAAVAAANQPEINAAAGQVQQQKQVIANQGGARTGGTNAATQQLTTDADAGVQDAIAKARGSAAPALAQIGSGETSEGLGATKALGSEATANREESAKLHADAIKNWANVLTGALTGQGAISGAQGWQG